MKRMLFLVLVALVMGCEKDVVDARDEFVGVYTCRVVNTGVDNDGNYSFTNEGVTMEVSKGPGAQLIFELDDELTLVGGLSPLQDDAIIINEDLVDVGAGDIFRISGEGFFGNKSVSMTIVAEATGYFDNSILSITGNKP